MELKLAGSLPCPHHLAGSNRTFMELKSSSAAARNMSRDSSNRTFMELKLPCAPCTAIRYRCSNRTFMELKLS